MMGGQGRGLKGPGSRQHRPEAGSTGPGLCLVMEPMLDSATEPRFSPDGSDSIFTPPAGSKFPTPIAVARSDA
jgi:hypothetical protein